MNDVIKGEFKAQKVKVRLNLKKSWYDLWSNAKNYFKEIPIIKSCYFDVNFRLKVKSTGEDQEDVFI